jgi:hypothetical protein
LFCVPAEPGECENSNTCVPEALPDITFSI